MELEGRCVKKSESGIRSPNERRKRSKVWYLLFNVAVGCAWLGIYFFNYKPYRITGGNREFGEFVLVSFIACIYTFDLAELI